MGNCIATNKVANLVSNYGFGKRTPDQLIGITKSTQTKAESPYLSPIAVIAATLSIMVMPRLDKVTSGSNL